MSSVRESIHADTNVDVEEIVKRGDETKNIKRKKLFLQIYISVILLLNLLVFASNIGLGINERFLIAGMINVVISAVGIYSHFVGQGIKQDFTSFRAPGGLIENMGVVEMDQSREKDLDQPDFTVFNPSATLYLYTAPLILGVIFIVIGFFIA